jgi:hypothetical protein
VEFPAHFCLVTAERGFEFFGPRILVQGLVSIGVGKKHPIRSSSREHTAGSGLDRPLAGKIAYQNSIFGKS